MSKGDVHYTSFQALPILALIKPIGPDSLLERLQAHGDNQTTQSCFEGLTEDQKSLIRAQSANIEPYDQDEIWTDEVAVRALRELTEDASSSLYKLQFSE